jgi:simple sugar transport system permease protein
VRKLFRIYLEKPELAGVALLVVLTLVFAFRSNGVFLSADNLRGILGLLPEVGLVSIGVTLLMICGEFDLSVGSMFALMPVCVAVMTNHGVSFVPAMLLGLAIAAVVGFANGFITLVFNIPSFIATLGMLFMVRSLTVVLTGGFPPLLSSELPIGIFTQFVGPAGILRVSFIWFAVVALIAGAMLGGSNFGNWIRATGGFLDAAKSMGVPVWRVKMSCFVICSMLNGGARVAGEDVLLLHMLHAGRLCGNDPSLPVRFRASLNRRRARVTGGSRSSDRRDCLDRRCWHGARRYRWSATHSCHR